MSVTPTQLLDGQDAFVTFSGVPSPNANDYITVSCGDTIDLNDYIDAQFVGPFSPATITNVVLFVSRH